MEQYNSAKLTWQQKEEAMKDAIEVGLNLFNLLLRRLFLDHDIIFYYLLSSRCNRYTNYIYTYVPAPKGRGAMLFGVELVLFV